MKLFKPLQRFFGGAGQTTIHMIPKGVRTTARHSSGNSTTYTILSGGLEITMRHHYDGMDGTNANSERNEPSKTPVVDILDSIRMYGRLANRTLADNVRDGSIHAGWDGPEMCALNAASGIASESGEINEIIKKWLFHGHPMDDETRVHLKKELGDMQWYIALMCYAMDFDDAEILGLNIAKLRARYPDGFTTEKSLNRAPGDI